MSCAAMGDSHDSLKVASSNAESAGAESRTAVTGESVKGTPSGLQGRTTQKITNEQVDPCLKPTLT